MLVDGCAVRILIDQKNSKDSLVVVGVDILDKVAKEVAYDVVYFDNDWDTEDSYVPGKTLESNLGYPDEMAR